MTRRPTMNVTATLLKTETALQMVSLAGKPLVSKEWELASGRCCHQEYDPQADRLGPKCGRPVDPTDRQEGWLCFPHDQAVYGKDQVIKVRAKEVEVVQ